MKPPLAARQLLPGVLQTVGHALAFYGVFWILYFEVPALKKILEEFDVILPAETELLIAFSDLVVLHTYITLLGGIAFLVADLGVFLYCFNSKLVLVVWSTLVFVAALLMLLACVHALSDAYQSYAVQMALGPMDQ